MRLIIFIHNNNSKEILFQNLKIAFGMNVDSINDPTNKLNFYIYESLKGLDMLLLDPLIQVNYFNKSKLSEK